MDLAQMRYVVEVAQTKNFTRAAERCFVTQSALSHRIAALERELGERLFLRSSRSVRLTDAGAVFVEHAAAALRSADRAREEVSATSGRVTGTLRLGTIPTTTAVRVPALIARYRAAHPESRVELSVGDSDALVDAVRRGDLDVAFLGLREASEPVGVAHRELTRERLVAVVPQGHRLADAPVVALEDLADEVFADFPSGTAGRSQSDAAFATQGVSRDVAFEVDSAQALLGLVGAGLAVTLLAPRVVAQSGLDVATIPLDGGPVRVQYVAWSAHGPRTAARAFLSLVVDAVE